MRTTIFSFAVIGLIACSGKSSSRKKHSAKDSATATTVIVPADSASANLLSSTFHFPYDLKNPETKWKLPKELAEISAITTYKKSKLLCVEDEDGKIFIYDLKKGDVKQE